MKFHCSANSGRSIRITLCALLLTGVALGSSGCMLLRPETGPTFSYVNDHLVPDDETLQTVLLPVFFPIGVVAALLDAFVVHPIMEIDDAAEDTFDFLWDDMKWDKQYMVESAALPWRIGASPIVFFFDWLGRSLALSPVEAAERVRKEDQRQEDLEALDQALENAKTLRAAGDSEEALEVILRGLRQSYRLDYEEKSSTKMLVLELSLKTRKYHIFERYLNGIRWPKELPGSLNLLVNQLENSDDANARLVVYRWRLNRVHYRSTELSSTLAAMLNDSSKYVRYEAVAWVRRRYDGQNRPKPKIVALLRTVAESDPSPFIRTEATAFLLNHDYWEAQKQNR